MITTFAIYAIFFLENESKQGVNHFLINLCLARMFQKSISILIGSCNKYVVFVGFLFLITLYK